MVARAHRRLNDFPSGTARFARSSPAAQAAVGPAEESREGPSRLEAGAQGSPRRDPVTDREVGMRIDSLRLDQATVAAARQAPRRCAACDPAKGSTTAPTTTAGTTLSVTATWQWSVSMQISLRISTGAAATETPATPAPAPAVEEGHEGRHGRAHVAQALRQLARAVRHELRAIVRDNPDMDPAVRDELRQIGKRLSLDGPLTTLLWRDAVQTPGAYRMQAQATDAQGARSDWAEVGILVEAETKPTAQPGPVKPAPAEQGPCGWSTVAAFDGQVRVDIFADLQDFGIRQFVHAAGRLDADCY